MKIFTPITKFAKRIFRHSADNSKYLANQARDMEQYGKKSFFANNPELQKEVNELTPFRRLSEKPTNLSDNQWFIQKFEEEKGKEFLPVKWAEMTEQEKADYIVNERYTSLIARKIMKKIKDEPVEHGYSVRNGEIISHSIGTENEIIDIKSRFADTKIHNHPTSIRLKQIKDKNVRRYLEKMVPDVYTTKTGFSGQDFLSATMLRTKSYLVDSNGNMFLFEPKLNPKSLDKQILTANRLKEFFGRKDNETYKANIEALAYQMGALLRSAGKTSKADIDMMTGFCKKYGDLVHTLSLGRIREILFKSEGFKLLMNDIGRMKEV